MIESHPAHEYAVDVLNGKIVAGRYVKAACHRHLKDLERTDFEWKFDAKKANRPINFIQRVCKFAEGENAGKPFQLMPFQLFKIGALFGFVSKADESRRFQIAYSEEGKGNGKTPEAAALALFAMVADDEPSAEIYSAATTMDQASIPFRDAVNMVQASPLLRAKLKCLHGRIQEREGASILRPVSSERRSLDGKRVHFAIVDELHEHPNAIVVNKLRAGTKSRRQALIYEITNSGYDRKSICWQHHHYSTQILKGHIENDRWFAYICQLDSCADCYRKGFDFPSEKCKACDSWLDESVWIKANPGLGHIIKRDYLRSMVRESLGMPADQMIVKRLNFCIWTDGFQRWINMEAWGRNTIQEYRHDKKRALYLGIDLASTTDLAALAYLYEGEKPGSWFVAVEMWMPEARYEQRVNNGEANLVVWVERGWIKLAPGSVIDSALIAGEVEKISSEFTISGVGYDPWNADQMVLKLDSIGLPMIQVRQGFGSLSAPSKLLDTLVQSGAILHGENRALDWCMSNAAIEQDSAGNIKPSKVRSQDKIDGLAAIVNALYCVLKVPVKKKFSGGLVDLESLGTDKEPIFEA